MNRPQRVYWWTFIFWLVGACSHLLWHVFQMREQPLGDEVYSQMLFFQIAVFALTTLPYWLVALLLVLILEFATFGRVKRRDSQ